MSGVASKHVQFNGNNHPLWKIDCRASLLGKDCWDAIILGPLCTFKNRDGAKVTRIVHMFDAPDPDEPVEVTEHRTKMREAYNILVKSMRPQFMAAIQNMDDPKQIWEFMEATYNKPTSVSKVRIVQEFFHTYMQEGDSLKSHLAWFDQRVADLEQMDIKFGEEVYAILLLISLPPPFAVCRAALESTHMNTGFTIADVKTAALQDEIRRKGENDLYIERERVRAAAAKDSKNKSKSKSRRSSVSHSPHTSPSSSPSSARRSPSRHHSSPSPTRHHVHSSRSTPSSPRASSRSSSPSSGRWCERCRSHSHDISACWDEHPELAVEFYKRKLKVYEEAAHKSAKEPSPRAHTTGRPPTSPTFGNFHRSSSPTVKTTSAVTTYDSDIEYISDGETVYIP